MKDNTAKRGFAVSTLHGDSHEPPEPPPSKKIRLEKSIEGVDILDRPLGSLDPRDPLGPLDPLDAFVSSWLDSEGSDETRDKRRRQSVESFLSRVSGKDRAAVSISRQSSHSAPAEMDKGRKDAKGFATPSTPSLVSGCTNQSGATAGSQKYGADDPIYRSDILRDNNIILRPQWEPRPDNVRALVAKMNQARSSPEPPAEQIRREALFEKVYQGGSKTQVEDYFKDKVFALTAPTSTEKGDAPLQASTRALMNRQGVPFLQPRRGFFGPAANQCMGGSASCVNIAEKLNRQLREYRYKNQNGNGEVVNANVDSTAFSIAMNGNEARLYVSWKHDELSYYVSDVQCYLLSRPDHYIDFRKVVRNILDWGKNERLEAIRKSLDILIEEDRKRSMEEARAWRDTSPGTSSSSSSRGKKPRRS